jgi:hypothetical protein
VTISPATGRDPYDAGAPDRFARVDPHPTSRGRRAGGRAAERRFAPFLLWGVTGSGKTEVYLQAMAAAVASGRSCLLMVPEIALTGQIVQRVDRFGRRAAVLHSGLSNAERFDVWSRIRRGDAPVALGTRSALFAPLPDPGLIIVDEEQDASYKQDDGVRYHARDSAVVLARQARAVVVLGSATPALESYASTPTGAVPAADAARASNPGPCPRSDCRPPRGTPTGRPSPRRSARPSASGSPAGSRSWCCSIAGAMRPSCLPRLRRVRAVLAVQRGPDVSPRSRAALLPLLRLDHPAARSL